VLIALGGDVTVPAGELLGTKVELTVVGGDVVYEG